MIQITNISDYPFQTMNLVGNPGQNITFTLKYQPSQQLWFYNIQYLDFVLNQQILVVSPNILYQYSNFLPFGIACSSTDGWDPYFQNDFLLNRIQLFLLSSDEVSQARSLILS